MNFAFYDIVFILEVFTPYITKALAYRIQCVNWIHISIRRFSIKTPVITEVVSTIIKMHNLKFTY